MPLPLTGRALTLSWGLLLTHQTDTTESGRRAGSWPACLASAPVQPSVRRPSHLVPGWCRDGAARIWLPLGADPSPSPQRPPTPLRRGESPVRPLGRYLQLTQTPVRPRAAPIPPPRARVTPTSVPGSDHIRESTTSRAAGAIGNQTSSTRAASLRRRRRRRRRRRLKPGSHWARRPPKRARRR